MPVTFYSDSASLANFVFLGARESYYPDAKSAQEKNQCHFVRETKDVSRVLSFKKLYMDLIYVHTALYC